MFRWLTAALLFVTISAAFAQHQLTMPDLTALTSRGEANVSLDQRTGWLYVLGATRIMGVKLSGLARVSVDGFVDTSWQPTDLQYIQTHAIGPHGDVYTLGASGVTTYLSRYSAARGGAPIFRTAVGPSQYAVGSIPMLFGGHDRWLYYSLYELLLVPCHALSRGTIVGSTTVSTNPGFLALALARKSSGVVLIPPQTRSIRNGHIALCWRPVPMPPRLR